MGGPETYRQHRHLQHRLQTFLIRDSKVNWSQILTVTATQYNDPQTFWRKIKNLMDTGDNSPHHLTSPDDGKAYSDIEKEVIHRTNWQNVFTDDEDFDEDEQTVATVRQCLTGNLHRQSPSPFSDYSRLEDDNSLLSTPATNADVTRVTNRMTKTCPGQSGINKTILKQLPKQP